MMGQQTTPERLFYDFCLEDHVPVGHLLRQIDSVLDLDELRDQLKPFYSPIGRPSVDPELMVRMLLVGYCFGLLYALVIVRLDRRDLVWVNVTANPTAEWIARQITEAFPWDDAPKYLIRDRDRVYGTIVTRRLRAMGIRDKSTAPASPWQNGFAERLIGSIRRECVDHLIVLGEAHLRQTLRAYARYYNDIRTHRSLAKDTPVSRPVQRTGIIRSIPILGGLHHHYVRV